MDIRKGVIKAFDAVTYRATVQIAGSLSSWLDGVAVARNIPGAEMLAGRKCAVVFFDEFDSGDAVLLAVYE